ncbi:hypothetical protein HO133_006440 [Letharia lupina]|uniref:Uncharacterized protein n=1 Tax=Letharia lupina TaxID=560253 RepID=A0A8H6F7X4_9LECA|nr:uncharacterized protein HO133_006440 [Letharia lupina]KAF6218028.1 hypothetical protein HO133_006440 [Letharia lupina]
MTPKIFEMDNDMPDWTDDFDFGAFLIIPPDDVDQGDIGPGMHGDQTGQVANTYFYPATHLDSLSDDEPLG